MKKVILNVIIMLLTVSANAQIVEKGESEIIWGVRAAFDVNLPGKVHSNIINDKVFRTGTGATVGAVCNIFLGHNFYLEPAASLFYDTYSYDGLTIAANDYQESNPSIYKFGLRVPAVVGYSIPVSHRLSIAPFTGPEASYAFAGKIRVKDADRLDLEDYSLFGKFGGQRRFDCGWKIGIAFFSELWSFNIDGTIGMTNLMTNGMRFRESRGSVSLTRYF